MDACEMSTTKSHHSKRNPTRLELEAHECEGLKVGELVEYFLGDEPFPAGEIHRFVLASGMHCADVKVKKVGDYWLLKMYPVMGLRAVVIEEADEGEND